MQNKIKKLRDIKILFVEDEKNLVDIISNTFTKLGANFITAYNGEEGLEALRNNSDISLVVTDINMPKMNGLKMIENIRESGSNIPCVVMSAHAESTYIQRAKDLNVKEYTMKPFDFVKFIDLVSKLDISKQQDNK